jgi:glycosyltransferase involved in cell wall biosynthesis
VVTDAGDSPLIVGDTCAVVSPADPEALARALQDLLDEDPARLAERGRAARARILSEFSVDRLVQRTEKQLLQLLPQPSRCPA